MRMFFAVITMVTLHSPTPALAKKSHWVPHAFAQAGFCGLQSAEQIAKPYSALSANGIYVVDPTRVELKANYRYIVTPAISSGLIFWNQGRGKTGGGIGIHAVYLNTGSDTRVAPAVTFHFGELENQIYAGLIFAALDRVEFPDGRRKIVVPSDAVPDYITHGTRGGLQFYAGIVILGKSISLNK